MSEQNNIDNQHKQLSESHSQNPFDLARENQDFQREYDNAQEFYRKRPFVERFKKYMPWVKGLQGIGHTFSALSLGAGGIFTVYNYLFSDSDISDFQTWLFVGIGVVIFILVVIAIEAGKGHFLGAAMKNKFEAANQLLGEKIKPSLRKWAFSLVALSLVGSVFFGMMGTYYLATEKMVIDDTYQVSIEEAKQKANQADQDTKAHYQKQIESKYSQINEANIDIKNSCTSCYTMRRKIREQIAVLQNDISTLEAKQREALKDNTSNHNAILASLEESNNDTLDQDSKKAMGRGWILGVLTFFSDMMIVFCAWFIALYNDRLFREGKHIGAINDTRLPSFSIDSIYLNDLYEKQSVLMKQLGGGQFLADGNQLFLPTNQAPTAVVIERKKKRKKKGKKDKKPKINPIGFSQAPKGKTDVKIEAKKEGKTDEISHELLRQLQAKIEQLEKGQNAKVYADKNEKTGDSRKGNSNLIFAGKDTRFKEGNSAHKNRNETRIQTDVHLTNAIAAIREAQVKEEKVTAETAYKYFPSQSGLSFSTFQKNYYGKAKRLCGLNKKRRR